MDTGELLPDASQIPLDNPDVDKRINLGTTAPNCQPKHTREALKQEAHRTTRRNHSSQNQDDVMDDETSSQSTEARVDTGLEVVLDAGNGQNRVYHTTEEEEQKRGKLKSSSSKGSLSSNDDDDDGDRSEEDATAGKRKKNGETTQGKMGYIQMARLGYQELVNAIIRPPRADYKVRWISLIYSPMYL
jgi:hypothetical protein